MNEPNADAHAPRLSAARAGAPARPPDPSGRAALLADAYSAVVDDIHSTLVFDDIMQRAVSRAAEALECETSAISLKDHDDGRWTVRYVHGFPASVVGAQMDDDQERHAVLAITTKQPVVVNDAFNDERVNREHMRQWGVCAVLVVPLVVKNEALGVLFLNHMSAGRAFDEAEVRFASRLASSLAMALENARLVAEARRELEERRQAEEKLRITFSSIGDAIITTDAAGRVTFLNPVAERLTGWTTDEAEGRDCREVFHIVNQDTRREVESPVCKVLRTGRIAGLANHTVLIARDGTERPVDDSGAPIHTADGEVLGVVLVFRDVTELRRTQEAMARAHGEAQQRASELETLMEALPAHVLVAHDPECQSMSGNRFTAEVLGLPRTANLSQSAPGPDRPTSFRMARDGRGIPPDRLPIQRAARGEQVRDYELDLVLGDGSVRTLLGNAAPLLNEAGLPRGSVGAFVDITRRKQAEAALQESEARLKATLASMVDEVWIVDADGRVILVNDAVQEHLGVPSGHWRDIHAALAELEVVGPDGTPRPMEESPLPRALRGEVVREQKEIVRNLATGQMRWREVSGGPIRDEQGGVVGAVVVARDITDAVHAEEALRESEQQKVVAEALAAERRRLYEVLDTLPAMVCLITADHRVAFANGQMRRVFGESAGQRCHEAFYGLPEPCSFCQAFRVLETGKPHHWEVAGPNGEVIEVFNVPFTDVDGSPMILEMDLDVTEQRATQAELARHREHLEELVRERTTEVEHLNVRLQRAMAETHHRVKNNLQVIAGLVDIQQMEGTASVPMEEVERIGRHVRALASVHDVLTSVVKDGADVQTVSAELVLDKLLPLLRGILGGRKLEYAVEDAPLTVRQCSAMAVLVNECVSNAVKHGGKTVEVRFEHTDGVAMLSVSDDGPGFPSGFTPRRDGHTGFELIHSLGEWDLQGKVQCRNRTTGGARVAVTFPLSG